MKPHPGSRRRGVTAVALLTPLLLLLPELCGEVRTWTISGREGAAEFVSRDKTKGLVTIKLADGREMAVPFDKFSAADQKWLETNAAEPPAASSGVEPGAPAVSSGEGRSPTEYTGKWPDSVQAELAVPVEEKPDGEGFIYTTPHYEFHSPAPLGKNVVREFARMFECVFEAVKQTPFALDPEPAEGKFLVRLFKTQEDYEQAGGIPGSAGCYRGGPKDILVPLTSLGVKLVGNRYSLESREGNHTLIHELTHQLTHFWIPRMDIWLTEGWAEFITAQRYQTGRMQFTNPGRNMAEYQKENRGAFDGTVRMVTPLDLMKVTAEQWQAAMTNNAGANANYSSAGVLATYFILADEGGKHMWNYLREVKEIDSPRNLKEGIQKAVETHLIRGRSREELEKAVESALRRYGLKVEFFRLSGAEDATEADS